MSGDEKKTPTGRTPSEPKQQHMNPILTAIEKAAEGKGTFLLTSEVDYSDIERMVLASMGVEASPPSPPASDPLTQTVMASLIIGSGLKILHAYGRAIVVEDANGDRFTLLAIPAKDRIEELRKHIKAAKGIAFGFTYGTSFNKELDDNRKKYADDMRSLVSALRAELAVLEKKGG